MLKQRFFAISVVLLMRMSFILLVSCGSASPPKQSVEPTKAVEVPASETEVAAEPTQAVEVSEAETEAETDEIVVLVLAEPDNLAWYNTGVTIIALTRNSYEPLVTRDAKGALSPALAESWEQIDDNTWRFYLRQGVMFHDGEPFDANTVAWHINKLSPEQANVDINVVQKFEGQLSTEVIDEFTLDIKTDPPDLILPRRMYWLFMGSPQAIEADPEFQNMIGTGPYKLDAWNHGESIVLVANPDYWAGEPAIKKVTFIWSEDAALRLAMVRAGEADIGQAVISQQDLSLRVLTADIPETPFIRIDPNPPLDDIRVRKAICMAIDREAIVERIFSGFAKPATQLITSDVMGYNPDIPLWPYDPNQARALIEAARADGVPVDLELTIVGRIDMYANATKAMQDLQLWLAEIGLNVKLEMLDKPAWRERSLTKPVPENRRALFQSSHGNEAGDGIFTMNDYYHSSSRNNKFPNETMDDLISQAIPLTGEDRQQALAKVLAYQHDEIIQDCPMVHLQAVWGVSERVDWEPRFDNFILINTVSIK